ncbi:MAG: insulinase family protein [Treponema sp.]|nr:insulinase family protein [Treponema sp.]
MKKLLASLIVLSIFAAVLFAGDFAEYKLSNGIPVYAKKNTVNHIDSVCVVVKGGVHYYDKEYSGLENGLFKMMVKGSVRYSVEDLKDLKYETGCSLKAVTDFEGSWLSLTTIDEYLPETLPVLLNGFTNPVYTESEFNKLTTENGERIQSMLNEPVDMANYYARQLIFQNHEYATSPGVTPESVNNITIPAMKNHHAKIMDARRIYVVAITNNDVSEYLPLLEKELGKIKAGSWPLKDEAVAPVSIKKRPLVLTHGAAQGTGYFYRAFAAPSVTSDEYIPFLVARKIYDQTMHNVLRAKYGMCYVAGNTDFGIVPNIGFEILYRCNDPTDIKARVAEARNITAEGKYILDVDKNGDYVLADIEAGFEGFRNTQINALYGNYMTATGMAGLINESILMFGNPDGLENQLNQISKVTAEQVNQVFNKYFVTDQEFWFACVAPECEEETEAILR